MVDVLELRNDEAVFVALMFLEIDSLLVSFGYPFFFTLCIIMMR